VFGFLELVPEFIAGMRAMGAVIHDITPLRMSDDRQTAAFALDMVSPAGESVILVYLLQNLPDSDYVLFLGLALYTDLWTEEDGAILEELGWHIGLDLMGYLP